MPVHLAGADDAAELFDHLIYCGLGGVGAAGAME